MNATGMLWAHSTLGENTLLARRWKWRPPSPIRRRGITPAFHHRQVPVLLAFSPAAIQVDSGTTVTWEWTGEGGAHNVVHEDGEFESDLQEEDGATFEHTFEEEGNFLY